MIINLIGSITLDMYNMVAIMLRAILSFEKPGTCGPKKLCEICNNDNDNDNEISLFGHKFIQHY